MVVPGTSSKGVVGPSNLRVRLSSTRSPDWNCAPKGRTVKFALSSRPSRSHTTS